MNSKKIINFPTVIFNKIKKRLNSYEILNLNIYIFKKHSLFIKKLQLLSLKHQTQILLKLAKFIDVYNFNIIFTLIYNKALKDNNLGDINLIKLIELKKKNDAAMKIQLFWLCNSFLYTLKRYDYIENISYSYDISITNLNNIRLFSTPKFNFYFKRNNIDHELVLDYSKIINNSPSNIKYTESVNVSIEFKNKKK